MCNYICFVHFFMYICNVIINKQSNIMQEYINNIIKTGLANGVSLEQMMANPEAAAKAYLNSQLRSIEESANQAELEIRNKYSF